MVQDFAYEAWSALDQFTPHPVLEVEKKQIVDRTLERIEQATMMCEVDELLKLRSTQRNRCRQEGSLHA